MVRLAVDFENTSKVWWESGGRELWESLLEGFDGSNVVVDDGIAESWLDQAAAIRGWDGGPEYAPHPIRRGEIDEDEEL